jgi:hypothetical protein
VILLAGWYGRLGNRLRTFAHVIAAGIDSRRSVWNPCFNPNDAEWFKHLSVDPLCRFPPRPMALAATPTVRRLAGHLAGRRLNGYLRSGGTIPGVHSVDLGWRSECDVSSQEFQNLVRDSKVMVLSGFRFFHHDLWSYRERLRAFFELAPKHASNVASLIADARGKSDVLIGVHVRGGPEYRRWRQGAYYYDQATYIDLIGRAANLFSSRDVGFLICGNERLDLEAITRVELTRGTGVPAEDLYAFAACDYLIGPPSTFSSWSSFYGGVPRYVVKDPRLPLRLSGFQVDRELNFSVKGLAPRTEKPKPT